MWDKSEEKTWKTIGHMVTNKHVTCHEHLYIADLWGYYQLLMGNSTIYSYEKIWLEVKPAMAMSHGIWFVYGHPFHNQNPNTWAYMNIIYIYIYISKVAHLHSVCCNREDQKTSSFVGHIFGMPVWYKTIKHGIIWVCMARFWPSWYRSPKSTYIYIYIYLNM
jgi:hypothetical protein